MPSNGKRTEIQANREFQDAVRFIAKELATYGTLLETEVSPETPLIGRDSVVKSGELVTLLLALEDFAEDQLGKQFDWRSDSAFSEMRSAFRTVGSLARQVVGLSSTEE